MKSDEQPRKRVETGVGGLNQSYCGLHLSPRKCRPLTAHGAHVKIPLSLKELGLPADKIDWTAEQAIGIGRLIKNNRCTIELSGMKTLLHAAYEGDFAAAAQ